MSVDYLTGDSLETLRTLDDNSVDLSTCSPPFLALRNYNDLDGQWGSEPTPADFLRNLLDLATETRRVLTPYGSLAWELGDTYSGSGGAGGDYNADGFRAGETKFKGSASKRSSGWPLAKSLTGIPTLFAWSLAYGRNLLDPTQTFEPWRIRNMIVWARNNPAPGALGDKVRPATSYITVATPSKKRWFDLDPVRRAPQKQGNGTNGPKAATPSKDHGRGTYGFTERINSHPAGAPPTDYWTDEYDAADLAWLVNGQPSKLAHYAMWPPKLAERLVLSMCPRQVCRTCREPRRRIARTTNAVGKAVGRAQWSSGQADHQRSGTAVGLVHASHKSIPNYAERETLGWSTCDCEDPNYRPGVVLDPFAGTGTTLAVADLHDRDAIGIDLDPNNPTLYDARRKEVKRALFGYKDTNLDGQIDLFGVTA